MSRVEPREAEIGIRASMLRAGAEIDHLFQSLLADPPDPRRRLFEAMRYAAVGGGKRLRPLLTLASAALFRIPRAAAIRPALAVECVHVHSLVHDDLPCMDDDDLRRGKATVHRAYDEATAVLAGDALLALAFEIIASPETPLCGEVRSELVAELARSAGASGMAGGQMLDLLPPEEPADLDAITRLQRLKTGALIGWCVEAGAIMGRAPAEARTSLRGYGHCLGLAFQIADDLLDHGGDEAKVGKRLRKDEEQGKVTFVTLLGEDRARRQADLLVAQAIEHLRGFGPEALPLEAIACFVINRDR
jgi:farnesyl diphosphate synthase